MTKDKSKKKIIIVLIIVIVIIAVATIVFILSQKFYFFNGVKIISNGYNVKRGSVTVEKYEYGGIASRNYRKKIDQGWYRKGQIFGIKKQTLKQSSIGGCEDDEQSLDDDSFMFDKLSIGTEYVLKEKGNKTFCYAEFNGKEIKICSCFGGKNEEK